VVIRLNVITTQTHSAGKIRKARRQKNAQTSGRGPTPMLFNANGR